MVAHPGSNERKSIGYPTRATDYRKMFERVVRLARIGVWECELPSEELTWSDTVYDLFGMPRGAPLRRAEIVELYEPRSRAEMERRRAEAVRSGTGFCIDVLIRPRGGGDRWIRITADVEQVNGRSVRMFGTKQDITFEKQAQEKVQSLQNELIHLSRVSAMDTMASSLAHELNQPLAMVVNYMEAARRIAERECVSEELNHLIGEAGSSALRAGEIIRRLRSMTATGEARRHEIDLEETVREAVSLASAGQENMSVSWNFSDLPRVRADPIQIQQVLINLIKNACEAARDLPCKIEITAKQRAGYLELCVADSGPGVPPEILPHVFEPFVTTKQSGMGVGLSIVRTIVEAHGGQVFARNGPRKGAEFCLSLPRSR